MKIKIKKGDKMEYRYKNIYLGETIEEIFPELNNSNTEYKRSTFVSLTDEIINRYDLYYDDFEEVYLSKKYKELVVIVDLADNIIGFSFVKKDGKDFSFPKDKIKNYLECKNLQDIYGSLYWSKTLDANIEKREIYGQLDNYKFTFDMITRDIKSIQNLETREFIKTYNWKNIIF